MAPPTSGLPLTSDLGEIREPVRSVPDSDSRYLFGGDFCGATEAANGSRGRPNNGLATRSHIGERTRAWAMAAVAGSRTEV